jgi:hypothetical protein
MHKIRAKIVTQRIFTTFYRGCHSACKSLIAFENIPEDIAAHVGGIGDRYG